jgi:hypothetical protein
LMREWLGASLAQRFGLPVPPFQLAYLDVSLVEAWGGEAVSNLGGGMVFASEQIAQASEIRLGQAVSAPLAQQRDILLFDLWVRNEDRTLSEHGGNPNLLWDNRLSQLFVIDHNLIFESGFDLAAFRETHVFRAADHAKPFDLVDCPEYENRMQSALEGWDEACGQLPEEWIEANEGSGLLDLPAEFQRLHEDAQGAIWTRLHP